MYVLIREEKARLRFNYVDTRVRQLASLSLATQPRGVVLQNPLEEPLGLINVGFVLPQNHEDHVVGDRYAI
ncbi:hypothetical protein VNO78_08744 [Psophocarpus tetragonolobus]|uniref:Uncharacterized protein n=1 Tax=Psophocarpus tetragonolobus TaxID=3891 RepID=A0AAN9SWW1_PSOTE